jgi:hypothetical protein
MFMTRPLVHFPVGGDGRNVNDLNMKKRPHHLVLLVALSAATLAVAQPSAGDGNGPRRGGHVRHGGPRGGHPVVRALDTDHDAEISAAEVENASAAIRTLDRNNDGNVSAEELRPVRPSLPAEAPARPERTPPAGVSVRSRIEHEHPAIPVMLALDANSDGSLSSAEIANASTSLAALDGNKDGKLTLDELRPLPPTAN